MKTTHPLIREIQLGKSAEELVRDHFLSYDFQGDDVYVSLPDIVRDIVTKNDETLRFAVKTTESRCEILFLNGEGSLENGRTGLEYWDGDHDYALQAEAELDCEILNEIVDRLYGVKRKKPKPKLTREQFLRRKGNACPYCGKTDAIVLDKVTWNDRTIMGCEGCGQQWARTHKVVVTGFKG